MIIYPNVGFIGFPLLQSLFGKQSLLLTALINMPFNLSLFTLGMMIMSNNKSFQIKKSMVSIPIRWLRQIFVMITYLKIHS